MRLEKSLILEPLQRRRDGADRVVASRTLEDVSSDLDPVRIVAEARDRKENGELEAPGKLWLARCYHKYYHVVHIEKRKSFRAQRLRGEGAVSFPGTQRTGGNRLTP